MEEKNEIFIHYQGKSSTLLSSQSDMIPKAEEEFDTQRLIKIQKKKYKKASNKISTDQIRISEKDEFITKRSSEINLINDKKKDDKKKKSIRHNENLRYKVMKNNELNFDNIMSSSDLKNKDKSSDNDIIIEEINEDTNNTDKKNIDTSIINEQNENNDYEKIYNIITGYQPLDKITFNNLYNFFFGSIPIGQLLNSNINIMTKNNKIEQAKNENGKGKSGEDKNSKKEIKDINYFDYNFEIFRNKRIYFYAKITKYLPYLVIKFYINFNKDPENNNFIKVGKIVSNILRNNFLVYIGDNKNNYKKTLNIKYNINFFGFSGIRMMNVDKLVNDIICFSLCNDLPAWDYEYKTYKLDFKGRVRQTSKKNFILKKKKIKESEKKDLSILFDNDNDEDKILLQCGKIDNQSYALDFIYPLSPFEAFSISITSIIYKFSCE